MNRLQRFAVLIDLIEKLKKNHSWCGETHIQKSTYFLQELSGVPLGFEFVLYKHGPFSFDLSDEITAMRADRILKLMPQDPYGPTIIPDNVSKVIKDHYLKTIEKYSSKVEFIAEKLGNKKVAELERLGTAYYFIKKESSLSTKNVARQINKIKSHISLDEANKAVEDVSQLEEKVKEFVSA